MFPFVRGTFLICHPEERSDEGPLSAPWRPLDDGSERKGSLRSGLQGKKGPSLRS